MVYPVHGATEDDFLESSADLVAPTNSSKDKISPSACTTWGGS